MPLNKDQILRSDDLPRELVNVPEWDGDVYLRVMSGTQRDEFEQLIANREEQGVSSVDVIVHLLANTISDENGALLFAKEDMAKLKEKNGDLLQRLGEQSLKLNGLTEEEVGEMEKNSETEPTDLSTSI